MAKGHFQQVNKFDGMFVVWTAGLLAVFSIAQGKTYAKPRQLQSQYKCTEGFSLKSSLCVKTVTSPLEQTCEEGRLEGGNCVSLFNVIRDCPAGFSLYNSETCVSVDDVVATADCPENYVLEGVQCVRRSDRVLECPPGSVPTREQGRDNNCVTVYSANERCSSGYHQVGTGIGRRFFQNGFFQGYCEKIECLDVNQECPPGSVLKNSGCESVKRVDPVCPSGTKAKDGQCLQSYKAEFRCPEGFEIENPTSFKKDHTHPVCKKTETAEVHIKCADGFSLNADKKCVKYISIPLGCTAGMHEDPSTPDRCVASRPATVHCPEGYVVEQNEAGSPMCRQTSRIAAAVICEGGFELENGRCVKVEPAPMVCPQAATVDDAGNCILEKATSYRGSGDFNLVNQTECTKTDTVEAEATCYNDFVLAEQGNYCKKREVCDPVPVCEKGYREGDSCVVYHQVESVYACPDGFEKEEVMRGLLVPRCVQAVMKDCSTVEYVWECRDMPPCFEKECPPPPPELGQGGARALTGFFRKPQTEDGKICEKVAVSAQKHCEDFLHADPIPVCPAGAVAQGKRCMMKKNVAPTLQCPEGELDEDKKECFKVWKKPAVYTCPEGYEKDKLNQHKRYVGLNTVEMCQRTISQTSERFCAGEGWTMHDETHCHKEVPRVCEYNQCERRVAVLADFQCPEGFHLYGVEDEVHDCRRDEEHTPTYACDGEGEVLEGQVCRRYADKECQSGLSARNKCERKVCGQVTKECEEGFDLATSTHNHTLGASDDTHSHGRFGPHSHVEQCRRYVQRPPDYFCSKTQAVVNGEMCEEYVDKCCPNGKCTVISTTAVKRTCPSGYTKQLIGYDSRSFSFFGLTEVGRFGRKDNRSNQSIQEKCVKIDKKELEYYCPTGELTEYNRCLEYVNKECPDGDCERLEVRRPTFHCEDGFTLNEKRGVALCRAVHTHNPALSCPMGEIDESRKVCRKTTPAKYTCLGDGAETAGQCVTKVVEDAEVVYYETSE